MSLWVTWLSAAVADPDAYGAEEDLAAGADVVVAHCGTGGIGADLDATGAQVGQLVVLDEAVLAAGGYFNRITADLVHAAIGESAEGGAGE